MRMDFKKIFFLLFPEYDDFAVLFWSASSDRPCMYKYNLVLKSFTYLTQVMGHAVRG
jgi:hypothetical protein